MSVKQCRIQGLEKQLSYWSLCANFAYSDNRKLSNRYLAVSNFLNQARGQVLEGAPKI